MWCRHAQTLTYTHTHECRRAESWELRPFNNTKMPPPFTLQESTLLAHKPCANASELRRNKNGELYSVADICVRSTSDSNVCLYCSGMMDSSEMKTFQIQTIPKTEQRAVSIHIRIPLHLVWSHWTLNTIIIHIQKRRKIELLVN